ncbi:MAG: GFA family protein [Hyphomonas sp.]|uniref:GFA family protein n=1 Tax=Hyphomonas sp. TaxID=87 RepID=UPI0034A01EDC
MEEWHLPWHGTCLCGQVKMKITAPPVDLAACPCTDCQKLTSGPYSLSLLLPSDGLEVTDGTPVEGELHAENQQMYCPHCKNWLFTRMPGLRFVNFRPGMLDSGNWPRPITGTMNRERLPFAETGAEFSFEGFPAPEDYGPAMAAYADYGARPPAN